MMRVLSLGAGVQSTTVALMAACGEITPMPDCAIFADTQAEPRHVYNHLTWLKTVLPFEVEIVTVGSLKADLMRGHQFRRSQTVCEHPVFSGPLRAGGVGRRYGAAAMHPRIQG